MTVMLDIPKEIEARLNADAQACGAPLSEFVRDFIIDHYEEAEDRRAAETPAGRSAATDQRDHTSEESWPGRLNTTLGLRRI